MACTLDTTIGGASANSYCSMDDAAAYHAAHTVHDTWDNADTDSRCRALQTATRLLDQWFDWRGTTATSTQALLWPRLDVLGSNGYLEASDMIPTRVMQATAELARQLLDADRTKDADTDVSGVRKLKAGSVELEFTAVSSKPIPDAVMALVGAYGTLHGRSGGAVTLRRG